MWKINKSDILAVIKYLVLKGLTLTSVSDNLDSTLNESSPTIPIVKTSPAVFIRGWTAIFDYDAQNPIKSYNSSLEYCKTTDWGYASFLTWEIYQYIVSNIRVWKSLTAVPVEWKFLSSVCLVTVDEMGVNYYYLSESNRPNCGSRRREMSWKRFIWGDQGLVLIVSGKRQENHQRI